MKSRLTVDKIGSKFNQCSFMKLTILACSIACVLSLSIGCDLGTYAGRFENRPANPVGATGVGAGSAQKESGGSAAKADGSDKKSGSDTQAAGSDSKAGSDTKADPADDSHDQAASDLFAMVGEMTVILETVKDDQSANAAIPKITALEPIAESLTARFKALGKRDAATTKRIGKKFEATSRDLIDRLVAILDDLAPHEKLLDAMRKLKAKTPEPSYATPQS